MNIAELHGDDGAIATKKGLLHDYMTPSHC